MSFVVYYNEMEKRNVKNIVWTKDDAYEEIILQDVCTAYRVATEFSYEDEAAANAKADELNKSQEGVAYEKEGDKILQYYAMSDIPVPQYRD